MTKDLRNTLYVFFGSIILTVLSYFYIDKSVAIWSAQQAFFHLNILDWFSDSATLLAIIAPFCFLLVLVRAYYKKTNAFDFVLFVFSVSIMTSIVFTEGLKFFFGRYNVTSWIINDNYGFNFFHLALVDCSFPSAHTAVVVAGMSALWVAYPRFRWFYAALSLLVAICLVGRNHHFISDVIAGAALASLTAYWTFKITKILQAKKWEFKVFFKATPQVLQKS